MEKILDLSNLKPNDIVKLIPKFGKCYGNPECFCIVKSSRQISKKALVSQYTYERQKKAMLEAKYHYTNLSLVEFNTEASPWDMVVPTKTTDTFLSLNDTEYEFSLEISSLEELKLALLQGENAEIGIAYKEVDKKVKSIKKSYGQIFENAMRKLVAS